MNIKSLSENVAITDVKSTEKVPEKIAVDASSEDREGDGKQQQQGEQHPDRPMTEEEFLEAMEKIQEFKGFKESNLQIKIHATGNTRVINICDPDGKVVRRIPESELWSVFKKSKEQTTGHILDKAG